MIRVFKLHSIKELTQFSIPIILGQLGIMLISAGDMYVASSHSTLSVGAIGVATGFFNPIFLFGVGLMSGISPALAIRRGEGKNVEKQFLNSIIFATIAGFLLTFLTLGFNFFIPYLGIDKEMLEYVQRYIAVVAWSFPFAYIAQAVKEFLQSFEDVFFANLISILAVFVNLALNYLLVFGVNDFAGLGFDGLAIASVAIRVLLAIASIIYSLKYIKRSKVCFKDISYMFKFSLPIASMFFIEVLAFCLVSVLVGGMGVVLSATNTLILTVASVTFMIPLSISSAVGVKVGASFGEKNIQGVRDYAFSAIFMSTCFMSLSALTYILFPELIMNFLSSDPLVIKAGVSILIVVALFQLADGLQITLNGILRGLAMTKEPFMGILAGYWLCGVPFGIYLAYFQDMQAKGLWIGLAVSLTLVALFLGILFKKKLQTLKWQ